MQHHFNTDIAKKYDIITAILLDNIFYWTEKNKANKKHFIDGRYWTYNSKAAMSELFPYLTPRQIDYATKKMKEQGLILIENQNDNKCDRTLWYAITDFGYSILQNCEMYNNINITNTNTNIKENKKESSVDKDCFTQEDLDHWFDSTYSRYPRKVSKVQAKSTYEHKLRGLTREDAKDKANKIYSLLNKQLVIWSHENNGEGRKVEHIPYFSSWLNSNIEDSKHYKGKKK